VSRRLISSGSSFEQEIGYSRAVVEGDWVFVSGTTGFDYETMTISPDLVAQTEQCLRNVAAALAEAGSSLDDVVRVRYIVPRAEDFPQCWPALRRCFDQVRPAATMMAAGLADPRMRIEIEVTAHVRSGGGSGGSSTTEPQRRHGSDSADVASLLTEMQHRLATAWVGRDRAFIESVLADEWTVTDLSGRTLTRAQVLEETFASDERRVDSMVVDDIKVRPFGLCAVVTGRTRAAGTYQGQSVSVTLRFTDVFTIRGDGWQAVTSHATAVS
jgi:enamine deaminase RidA (YjgF/YER057c/UK114 family)